MAIDYEQDNIAKFKLDVGRSRQNIQHAKENSISAENLACNFVIRGSKEATQQY